jgi:hypothetical protein
MSLPLRKTDFPVGSTVVFTGSTTGKWKIQIGDTGTIKGYDDDDGPYIYLDNRDRTITCVNSILKVVRVVSGDEAAQLRSKVPRKGSEVVFTGSTTGKYKIQPGDYGTIKGFDDDDDDAPYIFLDNRDRTIKCDRSILKIIRVVSGDEAAQLRLKVPRKGSKVVFTGSSADGKIRPGDKGTIKRFDDDNDDNPQIYIDGLEQTLNCKRGILTILKTLDDVLEEKRKEKEQAAVEAAVAKRKQQEDAAAERKRQEAAAAEGQRQEAAKAKVIINCTLWKTCFFPTDDLSAHSLCFPLSPYPPRLLSINSNS